MTTLAPFVGWRGKINGRQENWTTLPDLGGESTSQIPSECVGGGFLLTMHPFLRHSIGGTGTQPCTATGSGGVGAFVDDTKITTTAGVLEAEGFETSAGP